MATKEVRKAQGYCLFCDDIRQEVGGKLSYMGVYHGVLQAHGSFPLTLPKFGIVTTYVERFDALTEEEKARNISIKILVPNENGGEKLLFESEIPAATLRGENADNAQSELKIFRMEIPVLMAPLTIDAPGKIKVRLYLGNLELKIGSLEVKP
jgi:hypothetical protein